MRAATIHIPALILALLCWAGLGRGATVEGSGRVAASNVHLSAEAPPTSLSATGLFSDMATLTPSAGIESYEVNAPAWNDGASERHWFGQMSVTQTFAMPGTVPKTYGYPSIPSENWFIPAGAVFVQNLELQMTAGDPTSARRIETRVLVKTGEGCYGLSYRWNDAQTDATLVASNGESQTLTVSLGGSNVRRQSWEFPARNNCTSCHTPNAGHVLSFKTAQLNRYVNGVNQIEQLGTKGYLDHSPAIAGTLPAMSALDDGKATISQRARSYLAVNCAPCHQTASPLPRWDVRFSLTDDQTTLFRWYGLVVIGDASRSLLIQRMTSNKNGWHGWPMPPLGSHVVDQSAVNLLSLWINSEAGKTPKATMTEQPSDTVATEGDRVSLTARAEEAGRRYIAKYAWYKNGSAVDTQTSPNLVIAGVTAADEGVYQVVAHTRNYTVPGKPFRLMVLPKGGAPRINNITGPTASTAFMYGSFAVDAVGSGQLTYQWRLNGKPIPGATAKSVILWSYGPWAENGGEYTVAVTSNGKTTVSEPWSVTVVYASGGVLPVTLNGSVTFKVSVSGPVANLQWLKNGNPVPGATSGTFTLRHLKPEDKASYTCRVSGPGGDQTTAAYTIVFVTGKPQLSPFQMPTAQTGRVYFFDIPFDRTPENMPSTITVTGMPKGLYFYYYPSSGRISGIVETSTRAPSSFPLTITATNPLGSVSVRTTLNLIPPSPSFAGVYTAIVKPSPEIAPQGGRLDVRVGESGMATGRLWLGSHAYPLVIPGYYFDSNYIPGAQYLIAPTPHDALSFVTQLPGENGETRKLFFAVDGTFLNTAESYNPLCGLTVVRPSGSSMREVSTSLTGWAKTRSALSPAGRYSFAMNGTVSHSGRGALSYGSSGYSNVAARLPDGTAFTTSAWMSDALDWMIYAPLYSGKGYVSGIGKASSSGLNFISGEATWNHPAPTKPTAGDFGLFTLGLSDP